jgi:hypothetical protein
MDVLDLYRLFLEKSKKAGFPKFIVLQKAQQDFMKLYGLAVHIINDIYKSEDQGLLVGQLEKFTIMKNKAQQSPLYNEELSMTKPDLLKAENEVRKELKAMVKQLDDYLITDASFWHRTSRNLCKLYLKALDIYFEKAKDEENG